MREGDKLEPVSDPDINCQVDVSRGPNDVKTCAKNLKDGGKCGNRFSYDPKIKECTCEKKGATGKCGLSHDPTSQSNLYTFLNRKLRRDRRTCIVVI